MFSKVNKFPVSNIGAGLLEFTDADVYVTEPEYSNIDVEVVHDAHGDNNTFNVDIKEMNMTIKSLFSYATRPRVRGEANVILTEVGASLHFGYDVVPDEKTGQLRPYIDMDKTKMNWVPDDVRIELDGPMNN